MTNGEVGIMEFGLNTAQVKDFFGETSISSILAQDILECNKVKNEKCYTVSNTTCYIISWLYKVYSFTITCFHIYTMGHKNLPILLLG